MKFIIAALVAATPLFSLAAAPAEPTPSRDRTATAQAKDVAAKAGVKPAKEDCKAQKKARKPNRDSAKG